LDKPSNMPEPPADGGARDDADATVTAGQEPAPTYPPAYYPPAYYWPSPYARPARPPVDPATVYKPGIWFYLVSVLVVAAGLFAASLPGSSQGPGFVWLAGFLLAFVWFVAFIITANDTRLRIPGRSWARWAGIPALGVLFVAIVSTNIPVGVRFDLSRSSLDQAAASARAGDAPGAGWIGLIPVDGVHAYRDGVVTVEVSGGNGCGYANFSGTWPNNFDQWSGVWTDEGEGYPEVHLSGDWWTWCSYAFDYSD
jgi:hypothetical protein